jgi:hypothetical protein
MGALGVSIYPEFTDGPELEQYVRTASSLGFTRVFTSLLLDRLHFQGSRSFLTPEFAAAWRMCADLGMRLTADVDEVVFAQLGCTPDDLSPLAALGIAALRVDSGLSGGELARLTCNRSGVLIELNASELIVPGLKDGSLERALRCIRAQGDLSQTVACFNFYPRSNTGLSTEDMADTIAMCKSYGVEVSAFAASQTGLSRLHAPSCGVCTVERHRGLPPEYAMAELFAMGVDCVLLGDVSATPRELAAMARLNAAPELELPVVYHTWVPKSLRKKLAAIPLLSRRDQPETVIRATDTRGIPLEPFCCTTRTAYSLTINNRRGLQYMGEVQIPLQCLGADPAVNVLGYIHEDARGLVRFLRYGGTLFRLVDYNDMK